MSSRARLLSVPSWIATLCAALVTSSYAGDPPLLPLRTFAQPGGPSSGRFVTGDVDGDGLVDLLAPTANALQVARGRPDGSFAPVESFAAPDAEDLLGLGDVDGDGDLDAVTDFTQFGFESGGLQVLLNDGNGAFAAGSWTYLGPVGNQLPLVVTDLDGDGLAEIVAVTQSSLVHVFRSTGGGAFDPPADYPVPGSCRFVAAGDLDLDGDVDLALPGSQVIQQLRNRGDGTFAAGPTATTTFWPELAFQLVDVTGDGRLDATCLAEFQPILVVLPGQPDGSFGGEVHVTLPYVSERARLASFDDDAPVDLAVSGYPGGITILRGLGGLGFEEVQRIPLFASWLDGADLNIDGRPDLLACAEYATVALALEDGGFDSTQRLTVDEGLRDVALADLDGDGRLDLLEAHASPNVVQVKLQQADGSFELVQTLPTLANPLLHTGHADGDSHVDLIVSGATSGLAAVALSLGDGTLSAFSPTIAAGRDLLLADMNSDGRDDLVGWGQSGGYELRVTYYDFGLGSFFAGTSSWPSAVPMGQLAAADIDQDGWVDILAGNGSFSGPILKWVNTGGGMLLKSFNPPLTAPSHDLVCGDVDGDGDPDLLALPGKLCSGNPSGQLDPPVSLSGLDSDLARVADLDADGFDDVLVAPWDWTTLRVLRGGASGLSAEFEAYEGSAPDLQALVVGDIDADGRLDVVTGSHEDDWPDTGEDDISILLHKAPGPFSDLGSALAGEKGEPELTGIGTLAGGSPLSLRVTSATPFAPARLIVGAQLLQAPFKGGVLVPSPALVLPPLPTDAVGKLVLSTTWPPALPSGVSIYSQAWITDAAGPAGFAATNGLRLTTP